MIPARHLFGYAHEGDCCRHSLTYTDDDVHLDIVDDGAGFAPDASEGYGLTTIRRRVADLGGVADVSSDAGGTTVAVSFPAVSSRV